MGRLLYAGIVSLDGYHVDASGSFAWAEPDEEVLAAVTADTAQVSTYLYGRRMYETMAVWETDPALAAHSPGNAEWARVWQAADKVVFSRTLTEVVTRRTRLEPELTADVVERAKAEATGDLTVDGPDLASSALRLGVVDAVDVVLCSTVVGSGAPFFPTDLRLDLALTRERRFGNGMVQLSYDVRGVRPADGVGPGSD